VYVYNVFMLSCVEAAALRRPGHSSKECYRLCKKDDGTEEEARAQQRAVEPLMNLCSILKVDFVYALPVCLKFKDISHQ
jgi:hypothetical protein